MTKKEPGLIIKFEDCEPNFEKDKLEVERFFKFLIEIAREDYSKKMDYENYKDRAVKNLAISEAQNIVLEGLMKGYEECYKKHYNTRTFEK